MPSKRLTLRDAQVLAHVLRYRLTTVDAIHRVFLPDNKPAAAYSLLKRLAAPRSEKNPDEEAYYLKSFPLIGNRRAYRLTTKGARLVASLGGFKDYRDLTRTPDWQTVKRNYALLAFFCERPATPRTDLIMASEFRKDFPNLCTDGSSVRAWPYYIAQEVSPEAESGSSTRIAFVHLATSGEDKTAAKHVESHVYKRVSHEPFSRFIEAGNFQVTVLVENPARCKRLRKTFSQLDLPCRVDTFVVPGLQEVIDNA